MMEQEHNFHTQSIQPLFNENAWCSLTRGSASERDIQITTSYLNGTGINLVVEQQDGVRVPSRHQTSNATGNFTVRREFQIPYRRVKEFIAELKASFEFKNTDSMLYHVFAILSKVPQSDYGLAGICCIAFDYNIADKVFKEKGIVYLVGLDIMVFTSDLRDEAQHPFSSEQSIDLRLSALVNSVRGIASCIEIIANDNEVGTRFIYVGGVVYPIYPVKNKTKESGIYHSMITHDKHGVKKNLTIFYTFQEGCSTLGLFPTVEEAKEGGNVEFIRSKILKDMDFRNKQNDLELAQNKLEAQRLAEELRKADDTRKQVERDHQEKIRRINEEFELKRAQQEQQYANAKQQFTLEQELNKSRHQTEMAELEKNLQNRRNKNEYVKMAVSVITGALSVYILMKKNKS